jgi:DNA-binding response OmpR family regulator
VNISAADPYETGLALSMKRILLVEDDQSICELMTYVLQDDGWCVTTAHNGAEALASMRASVQDLVLLDLMMPVLDGWGVLAERRKHANLRAVPVLAMSAGGNGCGDRAMALGANACMPKPFDLVVVLAALESLRSGAEKSDS